MAFTASSWGQGQLLTGLSPGSSETGFEAAITKANLPTSALDTGSLSCLNGGGDWRFSTDINGSTQLPVDIVTCVTNASAASTEFIAWVRFPTYASGTRSVYAFWNKAGESQPAASAAFGSEDVWQDNESAWHLNDLTDSAGNAASLSSVGSPTTVDGVIGNAKRFASSSDYLFTSTVGVVENDSFNITFWYKRQAGDLLPDGTAIGIADNSSAFDNYGIELSRDVATDTLIVSAFARDVNNNADEVMRFASVSEGDSVFISLNQSSTGTSGVGVHSGSVQSGTSTRRLFGTTPNRFSFNRLLDSSPNSGGLMVLDEIRLTSPGNTKSSDRVELEYDNQSNPSTFWTAGAVFVPGGGSKTVSIVEAGPSFTDSISASVTSAGVITTSILESGPSFTDSIASIVTGNISASIASNGPSFTDSITVLSTGNITASIVGTGPSFTDAISITSSAPSLITTSIIESGPSFSDAILVAVPTAWTDKVKVVTNWTDR
jgi:hypothetical protein